jgi:hypothetical protein
VQKDRNAPGTAFSESASEEKGDGTPIPLDDQRRGAAAAKEKVNPITQSTLSVQGTLLKDTWTDKKEKAEKGMETDPSPAATKEHN